MIGGKMAKDNGEMSILGKLNEGETLERLINCGGGLRSLPFRMISGFRYMVLMLSAPLLIPRMQTRIDNANKQFIINKNNLKQNLNSYELYKLIDNNMDDFDDQWTDGIITSSTSGAFMLFAMKLLAGIGNDPWKTETVGQIATLLGEQGHEQAESADAVLAIDRIKENICNKLNKNIVNKFINMNTNDAINFLLNDNNNLNSGITKDYIELIDRHGHRCVCEAELRVKDWAEDPTSLIKTLQTGCKGYLIQISNNNNSSSSSSNIHANKIKSEDIYKSKKHLNFITLPILKFLVNFTRKRVHLREYGKSLQIKLTSIYKRAFRLLAEKLVNEGKIPDDDVIYFLTFEELGIICKNEDLKKCSQLKLRAIQRRRLLPQQQELKFKELTKGKPEPIELNFDESKVGDTINGTPVGAGMAIGIAKVCHSLDEANELKQGEILICAQTDVAWTPYFSIASGLITELGGLLSHGAVVSREYGLPCIVGVEGACSKIKNGQKVKLDANKGIVQILS